MSHRVSFAHEFQFRYLQHDFFPILDVTLIGPSGEDDLLAIIDTGAKYCLFNGVRAASIGIDLTSGRLEVLSGLSGQLMARIHKVSLQILGTRFQCEVRSVSSRSRANYLVAIRFSIKYASVFAKDYPSGIFIRIAKGLLGQPLRISLHLKYRW